MDTEADRRMATLYLPERQIQMLPPQFTYGVGSLDPDQVRFAISLLVQIDDLGEVLDYEITPSLIRSRAAISYSEVDAAIADDSSRWHGTLSRMSTLAEALLARRERAGAITVNRQEMIIKVTSPEEIEVRVVDRSTPSRDLVTEMMVLCNSLMADYCKEREIPASYRSQSPPDVSDLDLFDENGVLRPLTRLQRQRLMRRFTPAVIGVVPTRHAGLGVDAYIQATSPLRRYPDLVMQRQISHYLRTREPFYPQEDIASVAQRAEVQLRELSRLEEERRRYWFLKHLMLTRLGASDGSDLFPAYVLENEPRRLAMLELDEYPFRARAELPESVEPGTTVILKLTGIDLWRRQAFFAHVPG
jgi:exoribonuclease-2